MPGRDAVGLRRNGGIINYPRFLEIWNLNGTNNAWSYTRFVYSAFSFDAGDFAMGKRHVDHLYAAAPQLEF